MKRVLTSTYVSNEFQAQIAERAYEIYVDDIEGMGYDTDDFSEVQLDVSEAINEAVDEFPSVDMLSPSIHNRILRLVLMQLRRNSIISI